MDDDFNVLVIDFNTLGPVNFLHFLDDIVLGRLYAEDTENIVGIDVPFDEASTCFDFIAFIDGNPLSERNLVRWTVRR